VTRASATKKNLENFFETIFDSRAIAESRVEFIVTFRVRSEFSAALRNELNKMPIFIGENACRAESPQRGTASGSNTYVARRRSSNREGHTRTVTCDDAHRAKGDVNGLHKFPKFVG